MIKKTKGLIEEYSIIPAQPEIYGVGANDKIKPTDWWIFRVWAFKTYMVGRGTDELIEEPDIQLIPIYGDFLEGYEDRSDAVFVGSKTECEEYIQREKDGLSKQITK